MIDRFVQLERDLLRFQKRIPVICVCAVDQLKISYIKSKYISSANWMCLIDKIIIINFEKQQKEILNLPVYKQFFSK